ncbi:DUF4007 family protein [Flavihumibacter sp. R14]|nr:DUF4007 family protein [Flavihumibacter soli]
MKISFSGHETFVCRQFWLKKGYDFIENGQSFLNEDAVVHLGVGKNMVTAIRFWLKGFNILDKETEKPTRLGEYILKAKDPFLEDIASLWLLHYSIVVNERVFIFNAFFNQFTKERSEFTKEQLLGFLKRKTEENELSLYSEKTYGSDINVFLRTYVRSNDGKVDLEDETSNLLIDLNLITPFTKQDLENKQMDWYRAFREERLDLPIHVILFCILDKYPKEKALSFYELLEGYNSPGVIFGLSEKGLEGKLKEVVETWPTTYSFTSTAGNRMFQIIKDIDKWEVLNEYYG